VVVAVVVVWLTAGVLEATAFFRTGVVADFGFAVFLAAGLGVAAAVASFLAGCAVETGSASLAGTCSASVTADER